MEREKVNNAFYDVLQEKWYEEVNNHPIALLQAENRARSPWIQKQIHTPSTILDVGCGGGLLSNTLAQCGHKVHGIDLSTESLRIAALKDATHSVSYSRADAHDLPFEAGSFDVVCALDILEHVEDPKRVVQEAARVLKPEGKFFFHTFNRNWVSYLVALKGVEWFVPNVPKGMHLYRYFIKPEELCSMLRQSDLQVQQMHGLNPICNGAFWRLVLTRRISRNFAFQFTRSLKCGYIGYAIINDLKIR